MRFDGSVIATSNGLRIVLSCEDGDTVPLSFKLKFPCSNNAAEYETYLTGLAVVLSMRVKHMRVLGDSNLVVSHVKGDFALREQSLAAYRTWAQKVEQKFQTFSVEYAQRSENWFADTLATLGSQIPFKGKSTLIRISKQENSIIGILKRMFPEESEQKDWRERDKREDGKVGAQRKYQRIERLHLNKGKTVQEATWGDTVQMY